MLSPIAKFGYIPGLDGLRALSVLIVIAAHFGLEHIIPGGFGVTVFFFISGFLITRLLIAESEKAKKLNLFNFYMRRLVRLYPALLFMIIGSTILFALFKFGAPTKSELFAATFYAMNILLLLQSEGTVYTYMSWNPLWSLAVEEHFYLVFPALIVFLNRDWHRLITATVFLLLMVLIWRFFIVLATDLQAEIYTSVMTDARIDSIVWGCFLALLLHTQSSIIDRKWLVGVVPTGIAILVLLSTFLIRDPVFRQTLRYSLQGAALLILFANLYYNQRFSLAIWILEWKPLAWLGRLSYPLYLWHFVMFDFWQRVLENVTLVVFSAVFSSVLLASISFYLVEKPTIALRKRFGAHIVTERQPLK
ncbi:MAG: acyltransferase [Robiginitomaculum sp.]|nr:acyltransferase [Robiginitomaculum sp.]